MTNKTKKQEYIHQDDPRRTSVDKPTKKQGNTVGRVHFMGLDVDAPSPCGASGAKDRVGAGWWRFVTCKECIKKAPCTCLPGGYQCSRCAAIAKAEEGE